MRKLLATQYIVQCIATAAQHTQVLPLDTRKLTVQARVATNVVRLAWASGVVTASRYHTIQAGDIYTEDDMSLVTATLYVASLVTGAFVEIMAWR